MRAHTRGPVVVYVGLAEGLVLGPPDAEEAKNALPVILAGPVGSLPDWASSNRLRHKRVGRVSEARGYGRTGWYVRGDVLALDEFFENLQSAVAQNAPVCIVANRASCVAVATEDLGVRFGDALVLIGRESGAALRGCSLDAETLHPVAQERVTAGY